MSNIRKAVIPVAGLGTRFLPVTKAVPKELLPIGTTPTLEIVIGEAAQSGIEEVVLVTSPIKKQITEYFSDKTDYDCALAKNGKESLIAKLRDLTRRVKITAVLQENPKGLGHAILCAKKAVGREPFVIILPDILIESKEPCCRQLISAYEKTGVAINGTERTPREKIHLYGVHKISSSDGRFHKSQRVIEKPKAEDAPSDFSVVGRYLFPPDVFDVLENTPAGLNGEIQLADAMDTLAKQGRMIAYEYEGFQFDTGEPVGFLKANIFYGRREYGKELDDYMEKTLCKRS